MSATDGFDRILEEWLDARAGQAPADLHATAIGRVRKARQRPRWYAVARSAGSTPGRQTAATDRRAPGVLRSIVILAILAALLAVAAWYVGSKPPRLPAPFGPAANGLLLASHDDDIFISDPHRAGDRLIVGGPSLDGAPRWSRDGTRFTFTRIFGPVEVGPEADAVGMNVMLSDADGGNIRTLTPTRLVAPEVLDWSPDGASVAVRHEISGALVVSIVSTDGSGVSRTLDLAGVIAFSAVVWRAPNGEELTVVGAPPTDGTDVAVYRVGANGGLRQVAVEGGQGDPSLPGPGKVSFQDLSVSPDGASAVYWDWEPGLIAGRAGSIHVLDLDTGLDRRLVFDPTASTELRPILTPDGSTIVFERQSAAGRARLMVAPLDASGPPRPLGPSYPYDNPPEVELSPDGSMVLTARKGGPSIFVDLATGASMETPQQFLGLPSWQRLAP